MKKITRTGTIAGAAVAVTAIGVIAGAANGDAPDDATAPKGPSRQAQIATKQAVELKAQAETYGAVAEKTATFDTAVGSVTETHFVKDGKTVRICASTVYIAGGGAQTCRTGEALTQPLVVVTRSGTSRAVSVAGIAPAATSSDVALTTSSGTPVGRGAARQQRSDAPAATAAIGAVTSEDGAAVLTFRSPATGEAQKFSIGKTVDALDAG